MGFMVVSFHALASTALRRIFACLENSRRRYTVVLLFTELEGGEEALVVLVVGAFVRSPTRIIQLEPAVATADGVLIL